MYYQVMQCTYWLFLPCTAYRRTWLRTASCQRPRPQTGVPACPWAPGGWGPGWWCWSPAGRSCPQTQCYWTGSATLTGACWVGCSSGTAQSSGPGHWARPPPGDRGTQGPAPWPPGSPVSHLPGMMHNLKNHFQTLADFKIKQNAPNYQKSFF